MDSLLKQYQVLSDKEKNAILVYKSSLGLLINQVNQYLSDNNNIVELLKNKDFIAVAHSYYESVKMIYDTDMFIKHTLLQNINMKSFTTFIMSIIDINYILLGCVDKIKIEDEMTLYRFVSYGEEKDDISNSELISTTTDIDVCDAFFEDNKNYVLYELTVDKGVPVLVCPYAIKAHYESYGDYLLRFSPKKVTIQEGDNQSEVVLYKSRCLFHDMSEEIIDDNFKKVKAKVSCRELNDIKRNSML